MHQFFADLLLVAHLFFIIVWLGGDLVVFWLSMSLLQRELPLIVRLDRAELVEKLDRCVVLAYLVTLPLGFVLAWIKGWWPVIAVPWLVTKLAAIGILLILGVKLIIGATGSAAILRRIADEPEKAEELEGKLRQGVLGLAPYALAMHLGLLAVIYLTIRR